LAPGCAGQALCRLVEGVGAHLEGDREAARARLEDGARRAAVRAPLIQALCLAQLGLIAYDVHDLDEAEQRLSRARAQLGRYALDRCPAGAPVLAGSALVRAVRGWPEDARRDATAAAALLDRLTDFAPWFAAEVELVLARAELRLSDFPGARRRLAAARRRIERIDGAAVLRDWLRTTEAELATYAGRSAPAPLTPAELRVLQFLPTHLSFREIGERTALSANTVKTQANTAYRKLDARSRSDAVARARELGLLES
jgi:LuxR family maltose regulon positive regulatory protein